MKSRKIILIIFAVFIVVLILPACAALSKPAVVIASPPSGSTYNEGDDVAIQSTSADSGGVVRVELTIDGMVVRNDTPPAPQMNYALIQTWKATQGAHTIVVRAYNATGAASDPAAISITVNAAAAGAPTTAPTQAVPPVVAIQPPTPIPPTPVPPTFASAPAACTNNAAFVADVTVPDGTPWMPGQAFNKIWRVMNTGTCAWTTAYDFAFVAGEAMATTTSIAVPPTAPGATADLLVAMVAPTTLGTHSGQWRLRGAGDTFFGATLNVTINVLGAAPPPPPASGCSGTPNIESFTASPGTITVGGSATLSWGAVTNADSAEIDQGIGGVETPGSATVSPGSTTIYTLTARCGGNIATKQATVNVSILGPPPTPPDLTVTNLEFNPATPAPGVPFQVRITINNSGTASVSDFVIRALRQAPGANCLSDPGTVMFDRHSSVGGGASTIFTENATIAAAGNYRICARLDHTNQVAESNESNNIRQQNLTVAAPGQPDLYVQNVALSDWTPNVGHSIVATVNVRNGGTAATGSAFNVRLLRQETGATCSGPGLVLFDQSTGALAAGAAATVNRTITWPSPTGTFRLCVVLDHTAQVTESNEGNNTLQSGNFTVSP